MRHRNSQFVLALITSSALCSPAFAQIAPGLMPPLAFQSVDGNDVELHSGRLVKSVASISIGPGGRGSLGFDWSTDYSLQQPIWGYVHLTYTPEYAGGPNDTHYSITIGGSTETFTQLYGSSTITNDQGGPATYGAGGYTAADGTVAVFGSPILEGTDSNGFSIWDYPIFSLTYPTGETLNYYWNQTFNSATLKATTSSLGYQLRLTWSGNQVTSAVVFNMNTEACDPAAASCTLTGTWPTLTWDAVNKRVVDNTGKWVGLTSNSTQRIITYQSGRTLTYTGTTQSNGSFKVSSFSDGKGTWTYNYPSQYNNVAVAVNPEFPSNARVVQWDVNSGAVTSDSFSGLSPSVSYGYDSNHRLTSVKKTAGAVTSETDYAYDPRGNRNRVTQVSTTPGTPANIVQSAIFPSTCTNVKTCNQPTSITDARGNTTDYTYDSNSGQIATATLPAPTTGAVRPQTRYTYTQMSAQYKNGSGQIVSGSPVAKLTGTSECQTQTTCAGTADEVKTSIVYDVNQGLLPSSISAGDGTGALTATTAMTYTGTGAVNTVDGPLAGANDTTRNYYDTMARPLGSIGPDPDGAGSMKRRAVRVTYDSDGRPATTDIGTATGQGDSDLANMTSLQQQVTSYDAQGRIASVKANAGGTTYSLLQTSYSTAGAPDCTAVRMNPATFASPPTDACALGTQGSFGPDRIVKYAHDAFFRITSATSGYGTTDAAVGIIKTYDTLGRLSNMKDPENNLTTYEYDGMNRLSKTRYPLSAKGSNASSTTDYEQLTYDPNGDITSRRLRDGTSIAYTFDKLNRVTLKDLPGTEPDVTYVYDNLSRLTQANQSGNTMTFTYDALSRNLTQVRSANTHTFTVALAYDLAGRRTQLTYPAAANALAITYDYLTTGEVTDLQQSGAALATYTYDNLGNRTSLTFANGVVQNYTWDSVSRLASLSNDLSGTANDLTIGTPGAPITYNPASQMTSVVRTGDAYAYTAMGNGTTAYTSNGLNQQVNIGGPTAVWDSKGNLTTEPQSGKTYSYSSENLMTSASGGVTLGYDSLTRLYQVAGASTTRFLYDGLDAISEYDGNSALLRRFVVDPTTHQPLVWFEGTGNDAAAKRFLSADERGSVVSVTGSSGNVIGIDSYDEYGKPAATNIGRFQYTGQKWIGEIGAYDYKARVYLPHLGIFAQTDPIGYGDGLNLYAYVHNDPVNMVDPLGLRQCMAGASDPGGNFLPGEGIPGPCPGDSTGVGVGGGIGDFGGVLLAAGSSAAALRELSELVKNTLPCSAANQSGKGVLIELGYTSVSGTAMLGLHHTFVMAIDPGTGAIYASRGGPASGPGGSSGQLPFMFVAVSGSFQSGFPDYGPMSAVQTVGYVNAPYADVVNYMNAFADATNASSLIYGGPSQNSNSYAGALLEGMGLRRPPPAQNAPGLRGLGSNSPNAALTCR